MNSYQPNYLSLYNSGELAKTADRLWQRLENCDICPASVALTVLRMKLAFVIPESYP